jgi:glycosyltransferase involved in cell wall biosynthesis
MKIALIGTRGVPARYGGFETCVEEVGKRLVASGHQVLVFCRPSGVVAKDRNPPAQYLGVQLVHLPVLRKRSLETLAHTAFSVLHRSLLGTDAAVVFNAANAPLLPIVKARGIGVATHVDGIEWLRAKWGPVGQRYYRVAESLAVRWSDALIADAPGIQDYYTVEFGAPTELIAYGAPILPNAGWSRIAELGLKPKGYHLVVARFEPENHVLEIIEGYVRSQAKLPLAVVGSAPYSDAYTARIRAAADGRVRLLGALWDQQQLDEVYTNALCYWHGHSVGGTNPSLLRAAGAGVYTVAYDVVFNREVIGEAGQFFITSEDVTELVEKVEIDPADAIRSGQALQQSIRRYNWEDVAARYERLCRRLAERDFPCTRPSGRRTGAGGSSIRDFHQQPAEPTFVVEKLLGFTNRLRA